MASPIDISKHRQAQLDSSESREKLRWLSRKMIESQENERKRVARELHDSVGGNLAAIKLALEQKLESMNNSPPDNFYSLENIIANIKDTITEVRRISNHLMPSVLEELGLLEAIRWLCKEQGKYHQHVKIIPHLEVDEDNIPAQIKITIYRVIQESMSNAFRHGRAESIQLWLTNSGDRIELCVTDNGCGFDSESVLSNPGSLNGLGLRGMKDRAEVCNGTFKISSKIGRGTQVKLSLPYGVTQ